MRQQLLHQAALAGIALVLVATLPGIACGRPEPDDDNFERGRHQESSIPSAKVETVDANGEEVKYMVFRPAAPVDWRTAYKACASTMSWNKKNMTLASFTSATAYAAVHQAALGLGLGVGLASTGGADWDKGYWIGLNDIKTEGAYTWPDGTAATFTAWLPNEPSGVGGGGGEDCVLGSSLYNTGQAGWNDNACVAKVAGYVCQVLRKKASAPLPPMPGTAPKVGPTGGLYSGIASSTTWTGARDVCQAAGTSLVKISSEAENAFVRANFFPTQILWLGGSDAAQEGTWKWVADGSAFTGGYTKWDAGEPSNSFDGGAGGFENYLMMWDRASGTWNDHANGGNFPFVCWVPTY